MPSWSQPKDAKEWMVRKASFRTAVLILSVFVIGILEFRFSWMEYLVGRYLIATNAHRPESGTVWDRGRMQKVATQTLEQMVTHKLAVQRDAQEATNLPDLIAGLSASQGTMISASQFKRLYANIPRTVADTMFSPIFMLRISAEGSWDRVYLEREAQQVGIYLLDRDNNVLGHTNISQRQLSTSDLEQSTGAKTLDDLPEFSGRTYPADQFFMVLDTLSEEIQRGILAQPERLLVADGIPARVGIGDEVQSGLIRIAVEMETSKGIQILSAMGQEWAVWQIRTLLEPRRPQPSTRQPWKDRGGDP